MDSGYILMGGIPFDGLASRPGGSSNTPRHSSCYRNRDKLRPFGRLASVYSLSSSRQNYFSRTTLTECWEKT